MPYLSPEDSYKMFKKTSETITALSDAIQQLNRQVNDLNGEVEYLNKRVMELERKAGVYPAPLPRQR